MRTDLLQKGYLLDKQVSRSYVYVLYKLDSNKNEIERIWFSNEDKMERRVERTFNANALVSCSNMYIITLIFQYGSFM